MANKSVIIASSLTGEAFESIDVEFSDSDSWQVVDPSDSDDGNFSYGDVTTDDDNDGDSEVVPDVDDLLQHSFGSPSSDVSMQLIVDEITHHRQELEDAVVEDGGLIDNEDDPYEEDEGESDEDDDVDVDDLDLDDELVPKWLNNKFEQQRMRKLGKRAYPKMKNSQGLTATQGIGALFY